MPKLESNAKVTQNAIKITISPLYDDIYKI